MSKKPHLPLTDPDLSFLIRILHTLDPDTSSLSRHSGVSPTTIRNWRKGKTRRPQHVTLKAVALALGWKMTFTKGR